MRTSRTRDAFIFRKFWERFRRNEPLLGYSTCLRTSAVPICEKITRYSEFAPLAISSQWTVSGSIGDQLLLMSSIPARSHQYISEGTAKSCVNKYHPLSGIKTVSWVDHCSGAASQDLCQDGNLCATSQFCDLDPIGDLLDSPKGTQGGALLPGDDVADMVARKDDGAIWLDEGFVAGIAQCSRGSG